MEKAEKNKQEVEEFKKKRMGEPVVTLTDEQAIFVENDKYKFIGK